jgi:hypothetical protein
MFTLEIRTINFSPANRNNSHLHDFTPKSCDCTFIHSGLHLVLNPNWRWSMIVWLRYLWAILYNEVSFSIVHTAVLLTSYGEIISCWLIVTLPASCSQNAFSAYTLPFRMLSLVCFNEIDWLQKQVPTRVPLLENVSRLRTKIMNCKKTAALCTMNNV